MKTDVTMDLSRSEAELLDEVLSDLTSRRESTMSGHDSLTVRALDLLPVRRRLQAALRDLAA